MSRDTQLSDSDGVFLVKTARMAVTGFLSNGNRLKLESEMPATYYTLDEIASKMQKSPLKMKNAIKKLQDAGFVASPTSLNPNGFRADCSIDEIIKLLS